MRKPLILALAALCLVSIPALPSGAGDVLDRLLNSMVLDAADGRMTRLQHKTITREMPLGQTFTTSPKTVEISRIAICQANWHESWGKDETLVLTLWDSPSKTKQIASAEMSYKWKDWEGAAIMFTLDVKVEPSTQYYFELTVTGGDGKLVGVYMGGNYDGRSSGSAYEAGKPSDKNIWFEVHARRAFDREAVYSDRFSQWNLDCPGLEKVKAAVAAKDWDKAVDELIAYHEARPDLVEPSVKPKKNPKYDASYDELVLDKKIKDDAGAIVDLGPNWNYFRTWALQGGVGLTRTGLMTYFRRGYLNTADEKFAKGFSEMMANMLNDLPSPLRGGAIEPGAKNVNAAPENGMAGGSMWAGLSIAARMNQMWYFYSGLHSSPNFTRDIRAAMIFNMVDMAAVLSLQKGGGNWDSQMSTALFELADRHPELAQSKEWFGQGLNAMFSNLMTISRADGSVQEPTFGYTTLIINRFMKTLNMCRKLKMPIEPKYDKRVEKTIEYLMYNTEPDGHLPSRGDTFNFMTGLGQLSWGADYYGREDFRWVATRGKEGKMPIGTSAFYPIGGWCIMRSDWSPEGLYLELHNGIDGAHGHADELSIVVDAYGSRLIADPGCYIYGTPEHRELSKTRKHATVTVDDADTNVRAMGPNAWASTKTADLYAGTNTGYGKVAGVLHTRKIAFLKPDYWVVSDTVTGSGEHEVAARFPFYPGPVKMDQATGACRTENASGNILILPCEGSDFKAEQYEYQFPNPGGGAVLKLGPASGVSYSKKSALPVAFASALVPFKGSAAPKVAMSKFAGEAFKIASLSPTIASPSPLAKGGYRGVDYVAFGDTSSTDLAFKGDALVVRTQGQKLKSAAWMNGQSVSYAGRELASSAKPIKSLELIYDGDTLVVSSSSVEPTLKVATQGAKWIRVGYATAKEIAGEVVEPFR